MKNVHPAHTVDRDGVESTFSTKRYLLAPATLSMALLKKFIRAKFALPDRLQVGGNGWRDDVV